MHYTNQMIVLARDWFVRGFFAAWILFGVLFAVRMAIEKYRRESRTDD